MSIRRSRIAALLVGLLFVVTETLAFTPQLHGCAKGFAERSPGAGNALESGVRGSLSAGTSAELSESANSQGECPLCRIATLAMVAQGGPPLLVPLPRPAEVASAPAARSCWLTLDRSCSRAPPRQ
jgi:hypothetical protein